MAVKDPEVRWIYGWTVKSQYSQIFFDIDIEFFSLEVLLQLTTVLINTLECVNNIDDDMNAGFTK